MDATENGSRLKLPFKTQSTGGQIDKVNSTVTVSHINNSYNVIQQGQRIGSFLTQASSLDGKHRPCPVCGGNDRFRFDNKEGRGTHICSQCGSGDGFTLVGKMFGYSGFKEQATAVEEVLGIEGKTHSKEDQAEHRRKLESERKQREEAEKEGH